MIRGHIKSIAEENGCVLISIKIDYPRFPEPPNEHDFEGMDAAMRFNAVKKKYDVKMEISRKEKQEINMLHVGPVNLFQDDEQQKEEEPASIGKFLRWE